MLNSLLILEESANTDMLSRGPMRGQLFRKAEVKSLRMTALIVAAFIVCWTPYYVVFIIFTFFDSSQLDQKHYIWIFFFGMANSMVNPLIYGAFHVCKRRRRYVNYVHCIYISVLRGFLQNLFYFHKVFVHTILILHLNQSIQKMC